MGRLLADRIAGKTEEFGYHVGGYQVPGPRAQEPLRRLAAWVGNDVSAAVDGVEPHGGGAVGGVVVPSDSAGFAEVADVWQLAGPWWGGDAIARREVGRSGRRGQMLAPTQIPVHAHLATVEWGQRIGRAVHRDDGPLRGRVIANGEVVRCGLVAADDGRPCQKLWNFVNQPDHHLTAEGEPDGIYTLRVCLVRDHVRDQRADETDIV